MRARPEINRIPLLLELIRRFLPNQIFIHCGCAKLIIVRLECPIGYRGIAGIRIHLCHLPGPWADQSHWTIERHTLLLLLLLLLLESLQPARPNIGRKRNPHAAHAIPSAPNTVDPSTHPQLRLLLLRNQIFLIDDLILLGNVISAENLIPADPLIGILSQHSS